MDILRPSQLYSKYFDFKLGPMISHNYRPFLFDITGTRTNLTTFCSFLHFNIFNTFNHSHQQLRILQMLKNV